MDAMKELELREKELDLEIKTIGTIQKYIAGNKHLDGAEEFGFSLVNRICEIINEDAKITRAKELNSKLSQFTNNEIKTLLNNYINVKDNARILINEVNHIMCITLNEYYKGMKPHPNFFNVLDKDRSKCVNKDSLWLSSIEIVDNVDDFGILITIIDGDSAVYQSLRLSLKDNNVKLLNVSGLELSKFELLKLENKFLELLKELVEKFNLQ